MLKWITKHPRSIVAILLTAMFVMSFLSAAGTVPFGGDQPGDAGIVDEIAHIPAGYSYLKYGDYRLNPEHPPLIKDLAALPLLFVDDLYFPLDSPSWDKDLNGQWNTGWQFLYDGGNDAEMILLYTRFLPLLLLFVLGIYIYKWTKELFGVKAGLLATLLFAFSPNFLAHSHYVTTDFGVAVFLFVSVYYFVKFLKKPSWWTVIAASIGFALASLAKFSAILLIPYFALLILAVIIARREQIKDFLGSKWIKNQIGKRVWIYILAGLIILILGHAIIALPYLHHTQNTPEYNQQQMLETFLPEEGFPGAIRSSLLVINEWPGGKALSTYFLGAGMVFARVGGGNSAFLMGQYSEMGWWYFYIVSFLLKVPLAMLILLFSAIGAGFVALARNWCKVKPGYTIRNSAGGEYDSIGAKAKSKFFIWLERIMKLIWNRLDIFVMITVMLMFWVAGMNSTANIGLRWMLPTFPFMFAMVAGATLYCLRNLRLKSAKTGKHGWLNISLFITTGLIVWYVISSLFAYPYYLAYFNETIGDKDNAYKYTVDSNSDWGQDLNRLNYWLEANNIDRVYIDYFGGGVPEHSIGEDKVTIWHSVDTLPPPGSYFALSSTLHHMGQLYADKFGEPAYPEMIQREPDWQIGHSILVFKITEEDWEQFQTPDEAREIAAEYLGQPVDTIVDIASEAVLEEHPNDFADFTYKFKRPCYVVWFETSEGKTAVYVDRLTGQVWGGYVENNLE